MFNGRNLAEEEDYKSLIDVFHFALSPPDKALNVFITTLSKRTKFYKNKQIFHTKI